MAKTAIINFNTGELSGDILKSATTLDSMAGLFEDETARQAMPQNTVLYNVQYHAPDPDAPGGLLFGTSFINPGLVGDEYFMTKGHFHKKIDTAEYYWCIAGQGILLMMAEDGTTDYQAMTPGVLCYIPRRWAHRLVNTGDTVLTIGACWPADAGHDYGSIKETSFGLRVKKVDGKPQVIAHD